MNLPEKFELIYLAVDIRLKNLNEELCEIRLRLRGMHTLLSNHVFDF